MKHIPVMLTNVLKALGNIKDKTIVDCTFGAGGYSRAFLEAGANVIAFDRDINVVEDATLLQKLYGDKFRFINAPFSEISTIDFASVNHVVFDLGVSSMQIDNAERGFSFRFDGPLDMRMDKNLTVTAAELIQNSSIEELTKILHTYGDIKKSKLLASILKKNLPNTTYQLKNLIKDPKDIAPVFQALRIAVNDEFGQLHTALDFIYNNLQSGGMCICVTFHSLEDRIVKNYFRDWSSVAGDPRLPSLTQESFKIIYKDKPDKTEIIDNIRARSAHMRAIIKL